VVAQKIKVSTVSRGFERRHLPQLRMPMKKCHRLGKTL
jgi:hypothetical protein